MVNCLFCINSLRKIILDEKIGFVHWIRLLMRAISFFREFIVLVQKARIRINIFFIQRCDKIITAVAKRFFKILFCKFLKISMSLTNLYSVGIIFRGGREEW